ncbi:MAG: hypothetical protein ACOZNI_04160 [Myxococcota bacterium]
MRHDVAGLAIETALPLPARGSEAPADYVVDVVAPAPLAGEGWPEVTRRGDVVSLQFAALARFHVGPARITCEPAPGVPEETLAHLLLDHVLPRVLAARGLLVLHASAVATAAGAVGFCGETGAGKSTLAASFALAGSPLVADDALVIAPDLTVHSTYPAVRLWPDQAVAVAGDTGEPVAHYTDKRRLGVAFAGGAHPLARVYLLEEGGDVAISATPAREAFLALARQAFRLDPADRVGSASAFERLAGSPVLRVCRTLRYPRDATRLAEVRAAVLDDLAGAAR